jgi:superfamily II DNA or RNA helicase
MKQLHKLKASEQAQALKFHVAKGYKGSVIAGTGFGKTRVGVLAIADALENSTLPALLLVPFDHLKDHFKAEFKAWGLEKYLPRVEMKCYVSLHNTNTKAYSIIVGDEAHLGMTDRCWNEYKTLTYERILMLTATKPEEDLYAKRLYRLAPTVYQLSLDDCVRKGLVAPYSIECVSVTLTPQEAATYKTVNGNFGYWKGKLGFDAFNYAQKILGESKKRLKRTANAQQQFDEKVRAAVGFYRAIRQRKEIVDHAHRKTLEAKRIVSTVKGKKLVFGGDNKFTDLLAKNIADSTVYHSGIKGGKKAKDKVLADFRAGVKTTLCSTKALNQGLDIPDASIGVICGLTSKALTMIQRVGRLVRIDPNDPAKTGKVFIVYVKDSQEEKWLRNALTGVSKSKVTWT